jgi:Zn-dependent protease with chaperone function
MDWPTRPQLYVTQTPMLNAGAVGFGDPFVVINSAELEHLTRDELRVLLAHELGHIMSGHVTYRTIAQIILMVGLSNLPFLAGIALCRSRSRCSSGTARASSPATAPRCSTRRTRTSCSPRS